MRCSQASWLASISDKFVMASLTGSAQMKPLRCCMTGNSGLAPISFRRVVSGGFGYCLLVAGLAKLGPEPNLYDRGLLRDMRAA